MANLEKVKELVDLLNENKQALEGFKTNPKSVVENFLGENANLVEVSKVVSLIKENLGNLNLEDIVSKLNLNALDTDGDGKFDLGDAVNLVGKFFKK